MADTAGQRWQQQTVSSQVQAALLGRRLPIRRRRSDGYLDATAMCQANGKRWSSFHRLDGTQQFLRELSSDVQIPTSGPAGLVQSLRGGESSRQGTWIHRIIGLKLAAWLSVDLERRSYQWYADTAGRRWQQQTVSPQVQAPP